MTEIEVIDFENFKVAIDADSNFWTIFDESIPKDIEEFYKANKEKLRTSNKARELRADAKEAASGFIKAVEKSIELTKLGNRIVIGDFANIILGIVAPTSRVLQCDISPCGAARRFFAITVDGIFPVW
ncbi:hypothetical protein DRO97_07400 [Archaeoglobales archaeon]|nr:MAG: hypothetical protein DRO97_07400 [Archaeoglobales archaeon]